MSTSKDEEGIVDTSLVLRITPEGNTEMEFFPVKYSEFVIDYVYSKEDRENAAKYGTRRIFCG